MSRQLIDLTGWRFGRLLVLGRSDAKAVRVKWLCLCDCRNYTIIEGQHLRKGYTISCGCYHSDELTIRNTVHAQADTRLYAIWCGMKQRCNNPNNPAYRYYGGRGIRVCPEWQNDFLIFQHWSVLNGYRNDLEIDRIDNDGNYKAQNCRWTNRTVQMNNTRKTNRKNNQCINI